MARLLEDEDENEDQEGEGQEVEGVEVEFLPDDVEFEGEPVESVSEAA